MNQHAPGAPTTMVIDPTAQWVFPLLHYAVLIADTVRVWPVRAALDAAASTPVSLTASPELRPSTDRDDEVVTGDDRPVPSWLGRRLVAVERQPKTLGSIGDAG